MAISVKIFEHKFNRDLMLTFYFYDGGKSGYALDKGGEWTDDFLADALFKMLAKKLSDHFIYTNGATCPLKKNSLF